MARHYKVPCNPPQPSLNPASHKTQGPDDPSCHIWGHKEEVIPVAVLLFMITLSRVVTLPLDPMRARYRDTVNTERDNNEGRNNVRG